MLRSALARFLPAVLALLLVLVAPACSDDEDPGPQAIETVTATATATATETPDTEQTREPEPTRTREPHENATPFPPELEEDAAEILEKAAELRESPPLEEVELYLIDREAAIEQYQESLRPEDIELLGIQSRLYALLGLVPEGTDYLELYLSLLRLGVLAYYDPELDAFFLLNDLGALDSQLTRSTMAHEFAHALQDQYHDLTALYDDRIEDWDALFAFSHVVEGNAVATEKAFFGRAVRPPPNCFALPAYREGNPPYAVVRELDSPYDNGLCFVEQVSSTFPEQRRIFDNLPVSTEQILHPDKYQAGEQPLPVILPSIGGALGEGWSRTFSSTFGEFSLQNLLILGLADDRARVADAAAGWGGDAWSLWETGEGKRLFLGKFAWDSGSEAGDFFTALADSLSNRAGAGLQGGDDGFSIVFEGKAWRAQLEDDEVTLVVSDDAQAVERVASALSFSSVS